MKSFIVSLIIGITIISATVFFTHRIETVSEKLLKDNRKLIEVLNDENFHQAITLANDMADYVDEKKLSLAIIMDHTDLDKIEMGIAELKGYIEGEIKTDALAKCNSLDVMIRHMPKNYKLKIENVL